MKRKRKWVLLFLFVCVLVLRIAVTQIICQSLQEVCVVETRCVINRCLIVGRKEVWKECFLCAACAQRHTHWVFTLHPLEDENDADQPVNYKAFSHQALAPDMPLITRTLSSLLAIDWYNYDSALLCSVFCFLPTFLVFLLFLHLFLLLFVFLFFSLPLPTTFLSYFTSLRGW